MSVITGDSGDNLLTGTITADTISGLGGGDTLAGGSDDDSLIGGAGADNLDGGLGDDSLDGGLDNDVLTGGGGNDLLDGGDGDDQIAVSLESYDGDARALGGSGNDTITGSFFTEVDAGADDDLVTTGLMLFKQVTLIDGGAGADTLRIDIDISSGGVALDFTKVVNFETFSLSPTTSVALSNANISSSGHLDVIMSTGLGSGYGFTVDGSAVTSGSLTITGGGGENNLKGGSGADSLTTGASNDTLQGGGGDDTIRAGAGSDTAIYSGNFAQYVIGTSGDAVTVAGPDGSDLLYGVNFLQFDDQTVAVVIPPVIAAGDESANLLTGDEGNDSLSGAGGNDTLIGGEADDSLNGGAGADNLNGGLGDDSLYGGLENDTLAAGGGNDLLDGGGGDDNLSSSFGNGYQGDVQAYGAAGDDTIAGPFFTDVDAGADDDTVTMGGRLFKQVTLIDGGSGNDTLRIDTDAATGLVLLDYSRVVNFETIRLGPTSSAVLADATITNGHLDVIMSTGLGSSYGITVDGSAVTAGSLTITGGGGGNNLKGGSGADIFIIGSGDDSLDGGGGSDTADYSIANGSINVRLALTTAQDTGQGSDILVSIENLIGGAFRDRMTGDGADNVIEGGGELDRLNGGGGNDTASYEHAASAVTVNLSSHKVRGGAGRDELQNFENVLGGAFNDRLTGDLGANVLNGAGGDDTVRGGAGDDVMDGGGGLNVLSFAGAASGVTASLFAGAASGGAGSDTFDNFAWIVGGSFGDSLTGDGQANGLDGAAGGDSLYGGAGRDTLIGGGGTDLLDGGTSLDVASYATASTGVSVNLSLAGSQNTLGAGADTLVSIEGLTGSGFDDVLVGSSGANVIDGRGGKDTITGGGGKDVLTGGGGGDAFVFTSVSNSPKVKTADLITDLNSGDRIDLSAIDADSGAGGDQAFHLVASFTHAAGELKLTFNSGTGQTLLQGDVDGDGQADLVIKLDGDQHLFDNFVF